MQLDTHHTEETHLVGPLTYMGHLGIFKTVKNSLTWATHLDAPLTEVDCSQRCPYERKRVITVVQGTLGKRLELSYGEFIFWRISNMVSSPIS